VSLTLAGYAGLGVAVNALADFSLDVFDADEPGTVWVATVRWVGGCELFDF
jgi:hypothetical protein